MVRLLAGLGMLVALGAVPSFASERGAVQEIKRWLESFDAALSTRDVARLAPFYDPDVTIFEGGETNDGWADYRDNHIGPELREFERLEFSRTNVRPHLLGSGGRTAYVASEYRITGRASGQDVDASGLETLILVKDGQGAWRIRHSHTSSRRRPVPATTSPSPRP